MAGPRVDLRHCCDTLEMHATSGNVGKLQVELLQSVAQSSHAHVLPTSTASPFDFVIHRVSVVANLASPVPDLDEPTRSKSDCSVSWARLIQHPHGLLPAVPIRVCDLADYAFSFRRRPETHTAFYSKDRLFARAVEPRTRRDRGRCLTCRNPARQDRATGSDHMTSRRGSTPTRQASAVARIEG